MVGLDIGCGGGDVAFDLARLVEPGGRVVAMDLDKVKIEIARGEASAQQIENIEFRIADVGDCELGAQFDFAHARFILSHLQNPERTLAKLWEAVRPGGVVVVTDTDFRGFFSEPNSPVVREHAELYTQTLRQRGGDANIGPRLPGLLTKSGFENVQTSVVQMAAMRGEVKLMTPITMENIAEAVIAEGLASQADVDRIVAELYEFARDPNTLLSGPRIIEAWAYRPEA